MIQYYYHKIFIERILVRFLLLILFILGLTLQASDYTNSREIQKIAKNFKLFAGTKASVQWERIFSTERRLKKYNLSHLPKDVRNQLKNYLILHAADSDRPIIPGL